MKKRANIIFSDLFGTLISSHISETKNGSYDDEYKTLTNFLNEYLVDDNYFVFISSKSHMFIEGFIELFKKLTINFKDNQKQKITYCITEASKDDILREDDIELLLFKNGYKAYIVDYVINHIFNEYELNRIVAAGNEVDDISMLSRVYDLGGKSYLLTEKISEYSSYTTSRLINELTIDECILKYGPIREIDNELLPTLLQNEYNQLAALVDQGKLTKEDLIRKILIYYYANPLKFDEVSIPTNEAVEMVSKKMVLVDNRNTIYDKFRNLKL